MVSEVPHNERLEFLGDAVVEFLSSIHLFYMFPLLEEGGLSTYRTAIVQNQHLAVLAKVVVRSTSVCLCCCTWDLLSVFMLLLCKLLVVLS